MAYLDLRHPEFASGAGFMAATRTIPAPAPVERGFTAREWLVITLAERDPLRSLRRRGGLLGALARLFGGGVTLMLADARLEALRRLAVIAHHRAEAPLAEISAFIQAGFTQVQAETLLTHAADRRATRLSRRTA
jgi:hypothetical protein